MVIPWAHTTPQLVKGLNLFSKVRLAGGSCVSELMEERVPEGAGGGTGPPPSGGCQLRAPKLPET